MGEKTKKEHYVPVCYLKQWIHEKEQIWVYDKNLKAMRSNNIDDVASQKYYYDIGYEELSIQKIEFLQQLGINPKEDEQFIEHFFAKYIETEYSKMLSAMINRDITPWFERECCFISEKDKLDFALCMTFQYIRTNETRQSLYDMANCLRQLLNEMPASKNVLNDYILDKESGKNIQGNMILDIERIQELTDAFCNLTWILGVNHTSDMFYTSDNPIGTIPHVNHPYLSMGGIRSKGVEVYFPLSPKYILIMFDGTYHTEIAKYDRRYLAFTDKKDVEKYNKLCAYNSNRCIFSSDGNFTVIKKMLEVNDNSLDIPKISLTWNGKQFVPNREQEN